MAGRKVILATGEYYHVFNRGVAREETFVTKYDYEQAMLALEYYLFRKPPVKLSRFKEIPVVDRTFLLKELQSKSDNRWVDVVAFVLMPNHFHLLLKQTADNGISKYLSQFTNSYTKYFNIKKHRPGPVFQGAFKAVRVESEEQLVHLSRYIHLNPLSSFLVKNEKLIDYPWSSLKEYLGKKLGFAKPEVVRSLFKDKDSYLQFTLNQADYAQCLERIKHLSMDWK